MTVLKKNILCTLAFPIVLFLCNCSHLNSTPSDGSHQLASERSVSSSGSVPNEAQRRNQIASKSSARNLDANGNPSIVECEGQNSPDAEEAQTAADMECPEGDEDCEISAKDETPSDKEAQAKLDEALVSCEESQSAWQNGDLDNALESLDKAYALVLEVDTNQDPKLTQQKEDLRYLISKRILEIYASRNIVVNGNHDEIPMEMNSHIEAELRLFTTGYEKGYFLNAYQRSGQYRPYIVQALKKAGLPEELSWLPLIESGFKVKALSSARALGLWQFIPSTGYKFGLKRTNYVDERIDFIKATDAAIAYLQELHSIFGDWATVLAAYNCGEGRVLQVIRTQNVNYLDNFWDLYQRLPRETARYVPRFFATLHVVKNPERYGLNLVALDSPQEYDQVEINRQAHLKDIGTALSMETAELEALNPELRYSILPPEPYTLRIPKGTADSLLASLDTIPSCTLPQPQIQKNMHAYHRVRSGETLAGIARRYKTNENTIAQLNKLGRSRLIRAGQHLKIPQGRYVAAAPASKKPVEFSGLHSVAKGDSLWNIANRYGTTVQQINTLNNLSSNALNIGQKLKIPGYKPDPLPDANKLSPVSTYFVQKGDTPFTIANKHNITLERLLHINQLSPGSKIFPGQKLLVE
jgi:membrane-bound lytic murein transglycosylase D